MGLRHLVDRIAADRKSFGLRPALQSAFLRAVAALGDHRLLKCIVIQSAGPEVTDVAPKFECRFMGQDELLAYCDNAEYELTADFVRDAHLKGDRCFAILEGKTLASYGWYSIRPTAISEHLRLAFVPEYVYMYKGFTHPRYRGLRLHSVGMGRALNDYMAQGKKGIVSYVEAHNLSSLKSCYRMGYRDFGQIAYVHVGRRYFTHSSPGCAAYGFRVEEIRAADPFPLKSNAENAARG